MRSKPKQNHWALFLLISVISTIIADAFIDWAPLTVLQAVLLILASILFLRYTEGISLWVSIALISFSAFLIIYYKPPISIILSSATTGGHILVFLTLIEVLGSAIQAGGYDKVMTNLAIRYARSPSSLRFVAAISALMLNFAGMFQASVPAVIFAMSGKNQDMKLPIAISSSRGFGASIIANPFTPLTIMALHASGSSIGSYLIYALPVACFLILLDWLPRKSERRVMNAPPAPAAEESNVESDWHREHSIFLFIGLIVFILLYMFLGRLNIGTMLQVILALVGMAFILGYSQPKVWRASMRGLPQRCFRASSNILPLFVMGGMLGGLVVSLHLIDPVIDIFQRAGTVWLEAPFIALILIFFRWVGVAPIISVFIMGPVIAEAVTLPPPLFALALAFGSNAAFLSSPFSGTTLFIAQTTRLSPFTISVRHQGGYVLTTLLFVSIYLALLA